MSKDLEELQAKYYRVMKNVQETSPFGEDNHFIQQAVLLAELVRVAEVKKIPFAEVVAVGPFTQKEAAEVLIIEELSKSDSAWGDEDVDWDMEEDFGHIPPGESDLLFSSEEEEVPSFYRDYEDDDDYRSDDNEQ